MQDMDVQLRPSWIGLVREYPQVSVLCHIHNANAPFEVLHGGEDRSPIGGSRSVGTVEPRKRQGCRSASVLEAPK